MNRTRVAIVESHLVFRRLLRELLSSAQEIDVVQEEDGSRGTAERIQSLTPDVVLIDISLVSTSGLSLSRAIKDLCPTTNVVVLADDISRPYLEAILNSGANASIRKDLVALELVPCIRRLVRGDCQ